MNVRTRLVALASALAIVAAACAPAVTPTPPPVAPTPAPDETPAPVGLSGSLVVWHAYGSAGGVAEFRQFTRLLDMLRTEHPDLQIEALDVPFADIFTKFMTESAAGGGPDMFIAPNDPFGDMVRGGFLVDLTGRIDEVLAETAQVAIGGSSYDGRVWMVPQSLKAVAMYYDSAKVPDPPQTTDELLEFVRGGGRLGMIDGPYFGWPLKKGFGGTVLDEEGRCVAHETPGVADALAFVAELRAAGALIDPDYAKVNDAFLAGDIDIMFNGNWVLADYRAARPDVAVAPVPAGPAGVVSAPMTGVDGWYINSASPNQELAIEVAKFLTSRTAQGISADIAGHVPANEHVAVVDPLVLGFQEAVYRGDPRPQIEQFGAYWAAFGDAWRKVLDAGVDPATAVAEACETMNRANFP